MGQRRLGGKAPAERFVQSGMRHTPTAKGREHPGVLLAKPRRCPGGAFRGEPLPKFSGRKVCGNVHSKKHKTIPTRYQKSHFPMPTIRIRVGTNDLTSSSVSPRSLKSVASSGVTRPNKKRSPSKTAITLQPSSESRLTSRGMQ